MDYAFSGPFVQPYCNRNQTLTRFVEEPLQSHTCLNLRKKLTEMPVVQHDIKPDRQTVATLQYCYITCHRPRGRFMLLTTYVVHARGILDTAWNKNLVRRRPGVTHRHINGARPGTTASLRAWQAPSTIWRLDCMSMSHKQNHQKVRK
jgi:hypothetical protein